MKTTTPLKRVKIGYAGYHTLFKLLRQKLLEDPHFYPVTLSVNASFQLSDKGNRTTMPILY